MATLSSVFTSRITATLTVPHDPDHSVTIRKLAPKHLELARKVAQFRSIGDLKEIGPTFLKELQALSADTVRAAAQADPLLTHDAITLLEKGITAWTYDAPLTSESYEDLDAERLDFLAREILKLAKPSLFETPEAAEVAKSDATVPSTAA